MQRFRYEGLTRWWKGSVHVHSSRSDGAKSPAELAVLYASAGFDFIALTDHWIASPPDDLPLKPPLLVLDGVELDGEDSAGAFLHVLCLGRFTGIERDMGMDAAIAAVRRQGGITVLAHPLWSGNSEADALRHGFDGVEAYNNIATWLNGKGSGVFHWERMLERSPAVFGLAVDDAHLSTAHPTWNGGWIHVDTPSLERRDILESIRSGRFVASCGPGIHALEARDREVTVRCSPVRFARLVGPKFHGQRLAALEGPLLTRATFTVPEEWPHARIEVEDESGRRAWTNALFV
jgi:hypothetical protein